MKRVTFRQVAFAIGIFTAMACFGGSGTDCLNDAVVITDPEVESFSPCKAQTGEDIVIKGKNFFATQGSGYVSLNGVKLTVKSWSDNSIRVTLPAGLTNGKISVTNADGSANLSHESFEVGQRLPVSEVEPNDMTDGSDATNVGRNMTGTGTLSSLGDRDHFQFECIHYRTYTLSVSPRVVDTVYVNGVAVPLDASGKAIIDGKNYLGSIVVGLTGGTGAYAVLVE